MSESHETIDVDAVEHFDIESKAANKGKRFANYLIDSILSGIVSLFIANGIVLGDFSLVAESNGDELTITVYQYLFIVGYYILMEATTGRTLGKLITGTRVVNSNGEKASSGQIVGRSFARLIPFEPFSFLGERVGGWHDRLSKTYVIND